MVRERAQAFFMQGDSVLFNHRSQIAEMAFKKSAPSRLCPESRRRRASF
jgi:hypothetical protein